MLEWLILVGVQASPVSGQPSASSPARTEREVRAEVAGALETALARAEGAGVRQSQSERLALLAADVERCTQSLGGESRVGRELRRAATAAVGRVRDASEVADAFDELAGVVRERALDLAFVPRSESPRPAGFPEAAPVGEIVVLEYPAYRMARAAVARGWPGGTSLAFWTLFRHIEARSISMTAPVEMTFAVRRDDERVESMAFLYAHTGIGAVGREGDVDIVDVPAARVVSLGLRGAAAEREFLQARRELDAWLNAHPEWCAAGPLRVMAWNSPMVRAAERFFEVQLPIRVRESAAETKRGEGGDGDTHTQR